MKIGFVIDDTLDKPDGVQQYVITLGEWLHGRGHEVHYLTGETKRTDLPNIHSLSQNVKVNFNQNRLSIPRPANKAKIQKLLAEEKFDVLHVQMPYSPMLAGRIVRLAPPETAVIGTFHIVPFSVMEWIGARLLGWYQWRLKQRFDFIFSVSKPAAHFARQAFGLKTVVLPNVIRLSKFANAKPLPKLHDGKLNIVFLGRLVERKGCLHLLEAINELHHQNLLLQVRVLICGRGPLEIQAKRYVRTHRLSSVVHFVGFVPENEKAHYLASAHIAVFPSLGGESFGIVLLEAMAAGSVVVLGGNNPGYRSVLGKHPDQLIDLENPHLFARQIKHFMQNGAARRAAQSWQHKEIGRYDVNVVGSKLEAAYVRTLRDRQNVR